MRPAEIADNRSDLKTFVRTMFRARYGVDMKDNWHIAAICKALEKVVIGRTKRLIINIPPRSGKTEIAVVNFIAWCMGNWPDCEFIHASYSKRLATNNTFHARSVMLHERYAEIFGPSRMRQDSTAKDEFRTVDGGIVYATGADGTITGYGAGKMRDGFGGAIIIDDPHKAGEANSVVMRESVLSWFSTTIESRKNSPDTPIIIIMQRLHENDLSGFLLNGGNGEKWSNLIIQAIKDDGESFWEEQFPIAELNRMAVADSYRFAGQYMQRPSPAGGGIIKDTWWRFYRQPPAIQWRTIYADTASKTATQNDYSVFQCWGRSVDGQAVLLDQIRDKWEAPELIRAAKAFWNRHQAAQGCGKLRAMKVEDKSSGTGLIQTLKREGIPVVGIQRNTDKVSRAMDAAPFIESGNTLLPEDAPWLCDFLAEFSSFPKGAHDDQCDPTFDAITDISDNKQSFFIGIA